MTVLWSTHEGQYYANESTAAASHFRRLQEVFGGNAVADEYHIGRHVANLFVTQTYEGQSDIHGKCSCHGIFKCADFTS